MHPFRAWLITCFIWLGLYLQGEDRLVVPIWKISQVRLVWGRGLREYNTFRMPLAYLASTLADRRRVVHEPYRGISAFRLGAMHEPEEGKDVHP
jgi:hypothetical protein